MLNFKPATYNRVIGPVSWIARKGVVTTTDHDLIILLRLRSNNATFVTDRNATFEQIKYCYIGTDRESAFSLF